MCWLQGDKVLNKHQTKRVLHRVWKWQQRSKILHFWWFKKHCFWSSLVKKISIQLMFLTPGVKSSNKLSFWYFSLNTSRMTWLFCSASSFYKSKGPCLNISFCPNHPTIHGQNSWHSLLELVPPMIKVEKLYVMKQEKKTEEAWLLTNLWNSISLHIMENSWIFFGTKLNTF